jgi:hypothetical protein
LSQSVRGLTRKFADTDDRSTFTKKCILLPGSFPSVQCPVRSADERDGFYVIAHTAYITSYWLVMLLMSN